MQSRIKERAVELFFRKGYASTSVRDITNSLDITPAALYAHFSSKADLFLQIFEEGWQDVVKGLEGVINVDNNHLSGEVLHSIYKYYLDFYMHESSRTILLLRGIMFPPDELRDKVHIIFANRTYSVLEKIEEIFLKLMVDNVIKELPVREHIDVFYRLVNSFLFEITAFNKKLLIGELDKQWERYWLTIVK